MPAVTRLAGPRLRLVATFDDDDTELAGADVLVDGGVIEAVGVGLGRRRLDRVVDGRGLVVLPGLVNAHQHLYQGAARAIPQLERALIGPWLGGLGAMFKQWWQRRPLRDPTHVEAIAAAVLCESLLGGVTTVADQHYFHPAGPSRRTSRRRSRPPARSACGCTRAGARSPSGPMPTSCSRSTRSCATARS